MKTGNHLSQFGSESIEAYGLANIEALLGAVAWGTMGNPNDLGGLLLLVMAVFLSSKAYGLRLSRSALVLGYATTAVAIGIGFTALANARAFRLGVLLLIGMHLLDRLLTPGRSALRIPVMLLLGWAALAVALLRGGSVVRGMVEAGEGDAIRLELISEGLSSALLSGGIGRGLGAEKAMLDSGEIRTDFHNIVVTLFAELGLVVGMVFLSYLLALILSWAFATRSTWAMGHEASLARSSLAVALLIYGVDSSGVLESPIYWAFFAATAAVSGVSRVAGNSLPPLPSALRGQRSTFMQSPVPRS